MSAWHPLGFAFVIIGIAGTWGSPAASGPVSAQVRSIDAAERQPLAEAANRKAVDSIPATASPGLRWESVDVAGIGRLRMAVARPLGRGPFPAIVILHGSHGFAVEYLDLAREFARSGVLAVAVCWFSDGVGQGRRAIRPLECPEGTPVMPAADSDQAFATVDAVVAAVRAMPDSSDDQLALFGHSRGGGAVRNYLLRGGRVGAGIMNSAGYPELPDVTQLSAPILILHGEADAPADGGSAFTDVRRARAFAATVRAARKPIEAHYYRAGTHNGMFVNRRQHRDSVRRILDFMRRELR